jgi:hypothetical protein
LHGSDEQRGTIVRHVWALLVGMMMVVAYAACGDDTGKTRGTASSTGGGGAGGSASKGGASCTNPPTPDGSVDLTQCGTSQVSGTGPGLECERTCPDAKGNSFAVTCVDGDCSCLHNDLEICKCTLPSVVPSCDDHCCPDAWAPMAL